MTSAPGEEPVITLQKVAGLEVYCNGRLVIIINSTGVTGGVCAKLNQNSDVFEVEFFDENGEVMEKDHLLYRSAWDHDPAYATFEQHQEWMLFIYEKKWRHYL